MPRFTKLEREALGYVVRDVLAGDAAEFLNGGFRVDDPPSTPEQRHAVKLANALVSASLKL